MSTDQPTLAAVLGSGDANRAAPEVRSRLAKVKTAENELDVQYGPPTFRLFEEHVADALVARLDSPVAGVVLDGWRKYRELVEAAERSRDHPGAREAVELATHEIEVTNRYPVDVSVNGVPVTTLTFELAVFLELRGVIAELRNGRILAVRAGELRAGARLGLDGTPLAQGSLPPLPVGPLLTFGAGVELAPALPTSPVGPAPSAASPAPPGPASRVAPDGSWWTKTSAPSQSGETRAAGETGERPWWERTT